MLDPLTAFATAGTVLQVADFGARTLKLAAEYSRDGGTLEVASMEHNVQVLTAANLQLQDQLAAQEHVTSPGPARALAIANEHCLNISRELGRLLQSLKPDGANWFKCAKSALRECRKGPQLRELRQRLEAAKSNLALCFIVYTMQYERNKKTSQSGGSHLQPVTPDGHLEQDMQQIQSIWLHNRQIINQVAQLSRRLETGPPTAIDDISQDRSYSDEMILQHLDDALRDRLKTNSPELKRIATDMQITQEQIHREMRTRGQIIQNLAFPEIQDRLLSIKRAHKETYRWIFSEQDNANKDWHNFMIWMRNPNAHSMYWIRGKPGSGKSTLVREIAEHLKVSSRGNTWQNNTPLLVAAIFFWYAGMDGLDEFNGDSEERLEMLTFLESLTNTWVKVCVSSRPWIIYKDALETNPQLRLEDLTRADIEKFVRDSFEQDRLLGRKFAKTANMLQDLTFQVAQNAEGVFLWVRLVVRDLLKAVRDGCSPQRLLRVLDDMPRELDEYFASMIRRMDPNYRHDAAMILKLRLCNMIYHSVTEGVDRHGPTLRVFDLLNLDEDCDLQYFTKTQLSQSVDLISSSESDIREQFDTIERRLTSRSMGLLEATTRGSTAIDLLRSEVGFLHRTVKDFLCTQPAQELLSSLLQYPFDALTFRCSTLVDKIISVESQLRDRFLLGTEEEMIVWLECFLYHCQQLPLPQEEMINAYYKAASSITFYDSIEKLRSRQTPRRFAAKDDLYLIFAMQYNWRAFIDAATAEGMKSQPLTKDLLLDVALSSKSSMLQPNIEMVKHLLSSGALPNQEIPHRIRASSHWAVDLHAWHKNSWLKSYSQISTASAWIRLLAEIFAGRLGGHGGKPRVSKVVMTLLESGAVHHIDHQDFTLCLWETNTFVPNETARKEPSLGTQQRLCGMNCPDRVAGQTVYLMDIINKITSDMNDSIWTYEEVDAIESLCIEIDKARLA